jgi:beta-N-acetylhexosaminidase
MAAELRAVGVDFSFAPVLDVDRRVSRIIADRAFSDRPQEVSDLASAWVRGVHDAGMAAVGKHFPGHGAVVGDSHDELPIDERRFGEIETEDLLPFARLIGSGLEAVMPAHLVYSSVDPNPAGFSAFWLRHILRERLDFQGIVFSDDLNMAAAAVGGGYAERARRALDAGCDLLLVCNNRAAAVETIESLRDYDDPTMHVRCLRLHGRGHFEWSRLHLEPRWQQGVQAVAELEALDQPSLDL